jgi:hypothetical protein
LDAVASKGIKALLLCRVGVAESTSITSLPFSPKVDTWTFLKSHKLKGKLVEANGVIRSGKGGFEEIVGRIWGEDFYAQLVKHGRLQLGSAASTHGGC